ncbi:MAG: hypothetical protein EHM36_15195 [Deltaproteobacteria bacterium]|nr:MAG: hypothetical protein EHM36_15195 [Deltaproteobacteria bacterium]
MKAFKVALAPFLAFCPRVRTLGVRACLNDYSEEEKRLLREADRVFFPTPRYLDVFQALAKPTFPGPASYRYQRSRVMQQLLFQYLKLPHPRSRICFGNRQKQLAAPTFRVPFLVLGPRMAPDTVHLVDRPEIFEGYIHRYNPLIIQENVEWTERVRLIFVRFRCIGALRTAGACASSKLFEPIAPEHKTLKHIMSLTEVLVRTGRLDDVMIEWGNGETGWELTGISRPPVRWSAPDGIMNRYHYICQLIQSGLL